MSDLRNRYQQILKELEEHIQEENERNFVVGKFQELSMVFMDIIDRLTYITDIRVKEVKEKEKEIESKIGEVQQAVDGIENDIYEEGENYEFEIVCPYCNYEFVENINSDISTEIECPECHNIIELDWNGEDECEQECSHCGHECSSSKEEMVYDIPKEKHQKSKRKEEEKQPEANEDDEEDM